jgi:hypothetical protein
MRLSRGRDVDVGWAKARSDVPTIYHRPRFKMVGTLRFAHPTRLPGKGALALCVNGGHDRGYGVGHLTRLHSEMTTQTSIKR